MTPFGFASDSHSPARRRIDAAAREFAERNRRAAMIKTLNARRREVIRKYETGATTPRLRVRSVVRSVAKAYEVDPCAIMAADRGSVRTSNARHECYWRLHHEVGFSYSHIGRVFNRDHSTVMHGVAAHAKRQLEAT